MGYIQIFDYSVTGDCSNTGLGGVSFSITGDSPGWAVFELSSGGTFPSSANTSNYEFQGLNYGVYFLEILDAANNYEVISVYISTGTSISIETQDTTCGSNNGSVTGYTDYVFGEGGYLLFDSSNNFIDSGTTNETYFVFETLSPNMYYILGEDGGGCSGSSATFLIQSSTTFDFGYYVVSDADCFDQGTGKIFITGLTPSSAYTINWISDVNGQTGPTITGLTNGIYYVDVTDQNGCISQKGISVPDVGTLTVVSFIVTDPPSCFTDDGVVQVFVTGGTAPYYYSASTGYVDVSFSQNFVFTGLSAGYFGVNVTDSGLCNAFGATSIQNPNTFTTVDISTFNSQCSANNGKIIITIDGGNALLSTYDYIVSGATGFYQTTTFGTSIEEFDGLPTGNYVIIVSDQNGCEYTGTTSISNSPLYSYTANTTGTTCGFDNGSLEIVVSTGGTLPYGFTLIGPLTDPISRYNNFGKFDNLPPGTYNLKVTDSSESVCTEDSIIFISPSNKLYFDFYVTQPFYGSDGELRIFVTDGTPPYTFIWSGDVGTQTGMYITGLTSGEYTVEVTDSLGCGLKKSVTLKGTKQFTNYSLFTVCEQTFTTSSSTGKRAIRPMYFEGFYDLTSGDTNCIINNAEFIIEATVGSEYKEQVFYISSGITDYPTDLLWSQTILDVLNQFQGISNVIVNLEQNRLTITNDCTKIPKNCDTETYNTLADTSVNINLRINYDISCVSCSP